ncbi:MAG: undecaprenyl-diphosphate phosphatase [Pseudomonadota bacterium]
MPLFHLVILALIQGVTEFLPVSSSGHLVLYPLLADAPDQGLAIDVAVHVGTLFAVMLYFRRDVGAAIRGLIFMMQGDHQAQESRLALLLILSTIPVVAVGAALSLGGLMDEFRSIAVIGWMTIIWGVALYAADMIGEHRKDTDDWSLPDAVWMGLMQVFSLIPGTSRSGVTMTMARALGYTRVDAARLSMLMSIPTIIAAGGFTTLELILEGDAQLGLDAGLAAVLAFFAAVLSLSFMMRMLRTWSMTPFVIYRLILGVILLSVAYSAS